MTGRREVDVSQRCHALNNLLAKILWATEFALEQAPETCVKSELEAIAMLAQAGGDLVEDLRVVACEG